MSPAHALRSWLPRTTKRTTNWTTASSPYLAALQRTLLRPRRAQIRHHSTKPPAPPASSTTSSRPASRLEHILAGAGRFLPKRLKASLHDFRGAPASHIMAFLLLHEVTAVVPIFAMVGVWQYYDIVPVEYVFGPWAAYAQAGALKFIRWFKKSGWFGLGDEGTKAGEERFEEELDREARKETDKADKGEDIGRRFLGFWGKWRAKTDDHDEVGKEEVVEKTRSKTRKAVDLVKENITMDNTEIGYKVGIQIVAAYAITKVLFIPRIALSLWLTPPAARVMVWARKAVFRR